jgi:hypothetical protein
LNARSCEIVFQQNGSFATNAAVSVLIGGLGKGV